MNGVSAHSSVGRGVPATTILSLSSQRKPVAEHRPAAADETLPAAVKYPPRGGEPRSLAALVPEVLARYGLNGQEQNQAGEESLAIDLVA